MLDGTPGGKRTKAFNAAERGKPAAKGLLAEAILIALRGERDVRVTGRRTELGRGGSQRGREENGRLGTTF